MTVIRPNPYGAASRVQILNDVTAIPLLPVYAASVQWTFTPYGELVISASVDALLSNCELLGGVQHPLVVANDDVDVVLFASNELTVTAHAYSNGDGPFRLTTTDTLPTGLLADTDYWIETVDENTVKLHTSLAAVFDESTEVEFSDVGAGAHTIAGNSPMELEWVSQGFFVEGAGTLSITTAKSRKYRFTHSTETRLYAIAGDMSGTISAHVLPVKSA